MPLPSYTEIAATQEFKDLPDEEKLAVNEKYWTDYTAETPDRADFATEQKSLADQFVRTRAAAAEGSPLTKRFAESQLDDLVFNLRVREGLSEGKLTQEDANAEISRYREETAERDTRLAKTRSLFDPETAKGMEPAFQALRDTALRGGVFGSPALDARMSDILPGGEKNAVQGSKDAYTSLRKSIADDFHLEEGEIDDVIRHQLDLQPEEVSVDAFGSPYIKTEVLAKGEAATAEAINKSAVPWAVKKTLLDRLPEKLSEFKGQVVESVRKNQPELAGSLGFFSPVKDDTVEKQEGYPAGFRAPNSEELFSKLTEDLNTNVASQGLGGFAAGALGTASFLDSSDLAGQYSRIFDERGQVSNALNTSRTQIFGTDAAAFGLGAESVAEAVGIGLLTGGTSGPFSAARLASLGKTGRALAGGLNRFVAVSPIAGLGAAKSAMSTYDQAIDAGKTDDEASDLAWRSGLIEFGVTSGMSAIGLGGTEEVGQQLARATTRNALREGAKKAFGSFGGKLAKGLTAEQFEENLITALDATMVQTKINPQMTVDDFTKQLKDTALVTLGVSGPAVAVGAYADSRPTYEQGTPELKINADLALSEATEPNAADPLSTGTDATNEIPGGDLAAVGASALDEGGSDSALRDGGAAPAAGEGTPTSVTDAAIESLSEDETPTPASDEIEEGQRQGRQEVLTPEDDVDTTDVIPEKPITPERTAVPESEEVGTSPSEVEAKPLTEKPAAEKPETPLESAQPESATPAAPEVVEPETPKPKVSKKPEEKSATPKADLEDVDGEDPIALRNSYIDAQRKLRKIPDRVRPPTFSNDDAWQQGLQRIKKNPAAGRELVENLKVNNRALSPVEQAVLLHEQVSREVAVEDADKALNSASDENRMSRLADLEAAEASLADYYDVEQAAGTASGRSLQARKMAAKRDYSLARMRATIQRDVNDGAPLTSEQREMTSRISKDLEAAQARIVELEGELAAGKKSPAAKIQKRLEKDIEKALGKLDTENKRTRLKDKLKAEADAARARIKARLDAKTSPKEEGTDTKLLSGLDPDDVADLKDYAVIAASYFRNKILTLQETVEKLVSQFGESVRARGGEIYQEALKAYKDAAKTVGAARSPADIKATITPGEVSKADVYRLAKAHIIDGVRGEQVLDAVTADLQEAQPGITRAEVAVLFTDYGKTIYPSQDDVAVELRNTRAAEQAALKLKDVLEGKAPLRTGYQRGDDAPEVRALKKELNAAMRTAGIKVTSAKQQLKTSLDGIKSRMRNEIEDRQRAIRDRKPLPPAGTSQVEYDAEAKALRDQLAAVRKDYDAAFTKPGLTDRQRLQIIEKSLSRRIADEEKMLADGVLSRAKNPAMGPWTPQLAALQTKLDAMRKDRADARKALRPKKDPDAEAIRRAEAGLEKSIKNINEILRTQKLPDSKGKMGPWTPRLAALSRERARLMEALDALKKQINPPKSPEERARAAAVKALEKSITELQRRIQTGDLAPKARTTSAVDPQVKALRDQRDALLDTLKALRKAARPPKDPVQQRIDRVLAATKRRIEKLEEKLAAKDFTVAPKPDPVTSKEIEDARLQEFTLKREFNEGVLKEVLAKRTALKKAIDTAADLTFNMQRAVMTSIDIGAFGRQAGLVNFTRPGLALRHFPANFTFTDNGAKRRQIALEQHPKFKMAKDAKLALTEYGPTHKLSEMEEVYRSRLAKKIPGVAASERAYVTYLNTIRMAYFDMLSRDIPATDKDNLRLLAKHVNTFTGRGELPGKAEAWAGGLAGVFFSPKYWWSRLQVLGNLVRVPLDVATGFNVRLDTRKDTKLARKIIAGEYARLVRGSAAIYSLMAFALQAFWDEKDPPFKIGSEPTSSDFGKLVFKNGSRVDFMAGLVQNIVFLSRMISGKKTSISGKVTKLRGDDKDPRQSMGSVAADFARTKLAPVPGAAANLMTGMDLGFNRVQPETEIAGLFLPISLTETYAGFKELGVDGGTASALSNAVGYGVSTYGEGVKDANVKQDIFTGLYKLTGGKFGFPESRYEDPPPKARKTPKGPVKPKPPKRPGS